MPSTFTQAAKLLTTSEFALFAASRGDVLRTLTTARLLSKIRRARALRDKFRDLLKAADAREVQKKAAARARLALSRKRRADAAKIAARQAMTDSKARTKARDRVVGGPQTTSETARSARHAMKFKIAGQQAIHAHVSARGRRNQAKRDSRG